MNRWQSIEILLKSREEEARLGALQQLSENYPHERIDLIITSLGDSSWRIRKEAVNLFLSIPTAINQSHSIVALLYDDENAGLRNAASEILIRLGPPVLSLLINEASTSDVDVRKFIIDILGDIGDEGSIPLLKRLLVEDPDENVRASAAENLGKMKAVAAIPIMLESLAKPNLLLKFSILDALCRIGETISIEKLIPLQSDSLLRKPLYDALGRIGSEEAIPYLVAGLQDPVRSIREAAVLALFHLTERYGIEQLTLDGEFFNQSTTAMLNDLMFNASVSVRRATLMLLGYDCDSVRAEILSSYLVDEQIADDVVKILIACDHNIINSLIYKWESSTQNVKAYLAYIFGVTQFIKSQDLLLNELNLSDNYLKAIILRSLGGLISEDKISFVSSCLTDLDDEVRQAAVDSLVIISYRYRKSIIEHVHGLFSHSNPSVRKSVVQIIGRIGGDDIDASLLLAIKDDATEVRRTSLFYLDGGNPVHRPVLILALTDEDSDVRRQAIISLSMSESDDLIEPLRLVMTDEDPWVRASAVRSFGRLKNDNSIEALRIGLRDPVGLVTIAAIESFAEQGLRLDKVDLSDLLVHDDDDVVLALINYLSKFVENCEKWFDVNQLGQLLSHRNGNVRLKTIELLFDFGGDRGRNLLIDHFEFEDDDLIREHLREIVVTFQKRELA